MGILCAYFRVSNVTLESIFSTINIFKTKFCNKMKDNILIDSLILYNKREIFARFSK